MNLVAVLPSKHLLSSRLGDNQYVLNHNAISMSESLIQFRKFTFKTATEVARNCMIQSAPVSSVLVNPLPHNDDFRCL